MIIATASRAPPGRLLLLLAALVAAAVLVYTDGAPVPDVVPAQKVRPVPPPSVVTSTPDVPHGDQVLHALRSRAAVAVAAMERADPFAPRSWRKPVPPPPLAAPAPPVVPTMPYAYLGKQWQDGRWQVFLGLQGRTLVVQQGDTIDGTWRVESIRPPAMQLLHLGSAEPQSVLIGEGN